MPPSDRELRMSPGDAVRGVREVAHLDQFSANRRLAFELLAEAGEARRDAMRHLRLEEDSEAIAKIRRAQACEEQAIKAVGGFR